MRLIDAEEYIAKAKELRSLYDLNNPVFKIHRNTIDDCIDLVNVCSTIDAEPIKHGHWITDDSKVYLKHKCSECGYKSEVPTCMGEPIFTYCPICGSKMDLKDRESK